MKIKPEHYQALKEAVDNVLQAQPEITVDVYLAKGRTAERFRWDALWARGFRIPGEWYKYLNDNHIDTALRKITGIGL